MGLGSADLQVILKVKLQGFIPDRCAVAEIGAQQLNENFIRARPLIDRMGELFSAKDPCPVPLEAKIGNGADKLAGAPLSRPFWKWLGLDYAAIDVDGSPEAVALDLNFDEAPDHLRGQFHFVSNLGTTEHLINQMQAFKVIHDLTAVNGVMMHALPTQGLVNHGFFLYHPKFFFTLGRANGYRILYASMGKGLETPYPEGTSRLMTGFDAAFAKRHEGYAPLDCGITVCLLKRYDTPFVPPLDVRPGSETNNRELAERYWSIFGHKPFADLAARRGRTVNGLQQRVLDPANPIQVRQATDLEKSQTQRTSDVPKRSAEATHKPTRRARTMSDLSFGRKVGLWLRYRATRLLRLGS